LNVLKRSGLANRRIALPGRVDQAWVFTPWKIFETNLHSNFLGSRVLMEVNKTESPKRKGAIMPQNTLEHVHKGATENDLLKRMLGYNILDRTENRVGHVSGLWTDDQENVRFVGVKTTWFPAKTHVFPAQGMEVNHAREIIRAPYQEDLIKNAPTFDPGADLDEAKQQEIESYYYGQAARAETQGEVRIPLAEEQLKVGKRQVQAGGIRLRKIVRTEPVQENVELRREEIQVERMPATQATPGEKTFQPEDVFIPLYREEPVAQKEARIREEVRVGKKTTTERQTISEELRKEELQEAGRHSGEESSSLEEKKRERGI
jgi:uncharacterized protein (TIGR02271 family)